MSHGTYAHVTWGGRDKFTTCRSYTSINHVVYHVVNHVAHLSASWTRHVIRARGTHALPYLGTNDAPIPNFSLTTKRNFTHARVHMCVSALMRGEKLGKMPLSSFLYQMLPPDASAGSFHQMLPPDASAGCFRRKLPPEVSTRSFWWWDSDPINTL